MSTAFSRQVRKRKLKSDINVVPYIDVMLVLLVIFMITAPLLNLGVDIDLPQSNAKALDAQKEPVTVIVDRQGGYQLRLADKSFERLELGMLGARLKALHDNNPEVTVLVAGDKGVPYGAVSDVMGIIQAAGVDHISLVNKPPEGK